MIEILLIASVIINIVIFILFFRKHKVYSNSNSLSSDMILAQLPGHIYWKDKNGIMLGCNEQNWKDWGFQSLSEFIGKTDYEIFPKEQADVLQANDNLVLQTQKAQVTEEPCLAADGSIMLMLSHKIPLRDPQNKIIGTLGTSIEITKIKEAEIARLELLENIIAIMPSNVYWLDRQGVYLGCNDNEAKFIGLKSRQDIVGKRNIDLRGFLIPEALDPINEEVMRTEITKVLEEPAIFSDGTKGIFLSSKVPLRNRNNEVIGMVGISIDITERKKLESQLREAAIKEKKEQEEHIRTMRIFAGGIAHELRTPLAAMVNAASGIVKFMPRLVEGYKAAKEADLDVPLIRNDHLEILKDTAEHIAHEGEYAQSVITATLVTAQTAEIDTTKFITLSMVEIILAALTTFYYQNEEDKALVHFNNENDFQFRGDATLMMNIMYNLLKNAIFFVHKAGKGEITIWLEKQKDKNLVYVKDTSFGIPKENLLRIFEGYFTTRDTGTGVGLPLVRRLMQSFNGDITCESVEGEYTMFTLTFPIITAE